jgi:poly(3-hydroxybutyrate) depolymerase
MRPWLLSALLLVPALAGGQPSVASLRARLDALPATAELEGARTGVRYVIETAERIERNHRAASARWRGRAEQLLTRLEAGEDPYARGAGQILNRGYEASFSPRLQGYAVYLPRGYDPSRTYPLALMLHGGSSNGNLFLAVVLGNNLDWESYRQQLYDDFTPRWFPDFIVVAPDGVGQVMWRWMGEQDVLEVLDDVQRHYSVDPERIVLGGLSNGGVGAYAVGSRHAWRFSHVQAMAGAPSWVQYAGGRPTRAERVLLERLSAMSLWENTLATDFRAYHGTQDPGPMRPAFVRELDRDLEARGLPARSAGSSTATTSSTWCTATDGSTATWPACGSSPGPRRCGSPPATTGPPASTGSR